MVEYADFLYYSGTNTPIVGEPVTVKLAGTDTLASLYASDASPIANPVYSDIHGGFSFYVNANLSYDIYVQGAKQKNFASTVATDKADKNNTVLTATSIGDALQVETGGDVKIFQRIKTPVLTLGTTDVTATATELNYTQGVTANIQSQFGITLKQGTNSQISPLSITAAQIDLIASGAMTNKINLNCDTLCLLNITPAPANISSTGTAGEIRIDGSYIYYCIANHNWKRAALTTW